MTFWMRFDNIYPTGAVQWRHQYGDQEEIIIIEVPSETPTISRGTPIDNNIGGSDEMADGVSNEIIGVSDGSSMTIISTRTYHYVISQYFWTNITLTLH